MSSATFLFRQRRKQCEGLFPFLFSCDSNFTLKVGKAWVVWVLCKKIIFVKMTQGTKNVCFSFCDRWKIIISYVRGVKNAKLICQERKIIILYVRDVKVTKLICERLFIWFSLWSIIENVYYIIFFSFLKKNSNRGVKFKKWGEGREIWT